MTKRQSDDHGTMDLEIDLGDGTTINHMTGEVTRHVADDRDPTEATTYTIRYTRKVPAEQYGSGEIEIQATVAVNGLPQLQQWIWGIQRVVNERLSLASPREPRDLNDAREGRPDGLQVGGGHSEPAPRNGGGR
jgi:hypothetical protein